MQEVRDSHFLTVVATSFCHFAHRMENSLNKLAKYIMSHFPTYKYVIVDCINFMLAIYQNIYLRHSEISNSLLRVITYGNDV